MCDLSRRPSWCRVRSRDNRLKRLHGQQPLNLSHSCAQEHFGTFVQMKAWNLLEDPNSSGLALFWAASIMFLIVLSCTCFVLETIPDWCCGESPPRPPHSTIHFTSTCSRKPQTLNAQPPEQLALSIPPLQGKNDEPPLVLHLPLASRPKTTHMPTHAFREV
jgi:hypothetical protein